MTPKKIRLHKDDGSLELNYADGSSISFSAEFLRVHSPSAEVRGHGPGQETLQHGKKNIRISSLQATGHYALLIEFDDGHKTGIYSWSYLQELNENRDQLWRDYTQNLDRAGKSRDPDEKPLQFFDPGKK